MLVARSLDNAAAEYKAAGHEFSSPAGQRALQKEFVSIFGKGGTTGVTPVKPHALGFGDSAMEVGMVVHTTKGAVDISVSIFRVGKVVVLNVAVGRAAKLNAGDARALGNLGVSHINAILVPILVSAPTVTGTAAAGPVAHRHERHVGRRARLLHVPVAALRRGRRELRGRRRGHHGDLCRHGNGRRLHASPERDGDESLRLGHRADGSNGGGLVNRTGRARLRARKTYGGAMVSTWSALRLSCKRRSPVGLLKQPEKQRKCGT